MGVRLKGGRRLKGKGGDEAEGRQDVGRETKEGPEGKQQEGRQEMKPRGETGSRKQVKEGCLEGLGR